MREKVKKIIEARLVGAKRVLDVGGARELCLQATHVIDVVTYETARNMWGRDFVQHPIPKENWVVQDICGSKPFPFPDKFFDFVICSHTLEDVRDPIRVCSELSRVSKAGYIETPSPLSEITMGMDPGGRSWAGYYHHRWLVDLEEKGLVFLFKPHFLQVSRRFHFPKRYGKGWRNSDSGYTQLFWQDNVRAFEKIIVSKREMEEEIERIVHAVDGDLISMKYARMMRWFWKVGLWCVDRLGIRDKLRPFVGWVRR